MTRISVCIPTRDRAPYLREALRSVLAQSVDGLEVVVLDDGSSDETAEVVKRHIDRRIRYERWARPRGVAAARNGCLALARGTLIAWLDSDDLYEPDALERLARVLEGDPRVAMVHGTASVIDAEGRPLPDWPQPFESDRIEDGASAFSELVLQNHVMAPTTMVRRSAHDAAGPYAVSLERGEDWDMWLRLALEGPVAYLAEPMARYRYHADSLTGVHRGSPGSVRGDARVIERLFASRADRIPRVEWQRDRAGAALAACAIDAVGEAYTRGDRAGAADALELAGDAWSALDAGCLTGLDRAIASGEDLLLHESALEGLRQIARHLAGSRFGDRLGRRVAEDPAWNATLERLAVVVRRVVPAEAEVAVADKWDPTLRHLSGRSGRTFPDRRLLPGGYPPDSESATEHLERVRADGVEYLVFTEATRWWLEHYGDFTGYLADHYRVAWEDSGCVIYDLA